MTDMHENHIITERNRYNKSPHCLANIKKIDFQVGKYAVSAIMAELEAKSWLAYSTLQLLS